MDAKTRWKIAKDEPEDTYEPKWGGMNDGKDDTGRDDNGGEGRVLLKRRRGITANQNGMKG